MPSGVASGSCGREPGVGVSHCLKSTWAGPATTTGFGRSSPLKFTLRYSEIWVTCSSVIRAPAAFIMKTASRHSSGDLLLFTTRRRS